jgi:hypothetical protein
VQAMLPLRFQRLPADQLDEVISESLRGLVGVLRVDRTSLQALSEDGTSHRTTHGYSRPGIRPPEFDLELAAAFPWYTEQVLSPPGRASGTGFPAGGLAAPRPPPQRRGGNRGSGRARGRRSPARPARRRGAGGRPRTPP